MHEIELNDSELLLVCECLHIDIQASLSVLRNEYDIEHAQAIAKRIVLCNSLLRGLDDEFYLS